MIRTGARIGLALGGLGVVACGGGAMLASCSEPSTRPVASCSFRGPAVDGTGALALTVCQEVSASGASLLESGCAAGADAGADAGAGAGAANTSITFVAAPCPREDIVGGCRPTAAGASSTVWYYPASNLTGAAIQDLCTAAASTFFPDAPF